MKNFKTFLKTSLVVAGILMVFTLGSFVQQANAQVAGSAVGGANLWKLLSGFIVPNGNLPVKVTNITITGTCTGCGNVTGNYFVNSSSNTYLAVGTVLQFPSFNATSTSATSTIAGAGLQIGPTTFDSSGYDNALTVIAKRTYGSSANAQFKEGVVDVDCTGSGRVCGQFIQQSSAGTGSTPEMVNIQNQSTTATGILLKIKTASTQFSGDLGLSVEGPVAPAIEVNQDTWNGGTQQQGGGLFQVSSRDNNFTIDARNITNSGYCRQLDISPDFSSTTSGTLTLFPCLNAGGSTQLGTGRLNVTGTTTVPTLVNFDSTNTSTEGDIMKILENGRIGIATTTPVAKIDSYTSATTTANLLLETAAGSGGCLIIQDVNSNPPTYTEEYTKNGAAFYKVATNPAQCN